MVNEGKDKMKGFFTTLIISLLLATTVYADVSKTKTKERYTLEQSVFTLSIATLTTLSIADYFTARQALKYKGLAEANPIMKPFVKNPYTFAAVKISMTALASTCLRNLYKKNKVAAWILSITSNFVFSYIVVNNIRLLNKAKQRGKTE